MQLFKVFHFLNGHFIILTRSQNKISLPFYIGPKNIFTDHKTIQYGSILM